MSMRRLASQPVLHAVPQLLPASVQARRAVGTRQAMPEGLAWRAGETGWEETREPDR